MSAPPDALGAPALAPASAGMLVAFADDELLMGHRHSEWLGLSPFLEEDLAMASIAQDEIGHARALYALVWPDVDDRAALVVRRPPEAFRSCDLVELDGLDWERSLVRHACYDVAERLRWQNFATSTLEPLRALASKALQEERYHERHACDLIERLGPDPVANRKLQAAIDDLMPHVAGLFEAPDDEHVAVAEGVAAATMDELAHTFVSEIGAIFGDAGLRSGALTPPRRAQRGHSGRHERSSGFAAAHAAMLEVFAFDPSARW